MLFFFFFNDTATTEIYTLSLHDALPIFNVSRLGLSRPQVLQITCGNRTIRCGSRQGRLDRAGPFHGRVEKGQMSSASRMKSTPSNEATPAPRKAPAESVNELKRSAR